MTFAIVHDGSWWLPHCGRLPPAAAETDCSWSFCVEIEGEGDCVEKQNKDNTLSFKRKKKLRHAHMPPPPLSVRQNSFRADDISVNHQHAKVTYNMPSTKSKDLDTSVIRSVGFVPLTDVFFGDT